MIGLVVTSINPQALDLIYNYKLFEDQGFPCFIILDKNSEEKFEVPYVNFSDPPINRYEKIAPSNSYSRKNIGFIRAHKLNIDVLETDDDNRILGDIQKFIYDFDESRTAIVCKSIPNLFKHIYPNAVGNIWARGLPLEHINTPFEADRNRLCKTGVVQYLIEGEPDVDAIYRLVQGDNIQLDASKSFLPISLVDTFHPFNSQGTLWPHRNLCLSYLPATCSFRMTDIYRSYIAERILYSHDECLVFEKPAFHQIRNAHNLVRDFELEISGYYTVSKLIDIASSIPKGSKVDMLFDIYLKLVEEKIFAVSEIKLVEAFLENF